MKANKRIWIVIAVGLAFFTGCTVLSFYPLYTEDVLTKNDKILGRWETFDAWNDKDTLIWEIQFNEDKWKKKKNNSFDRGSQKESNKFTYSLFVSNASLPESRTEFQLHLVNLGGQTYIDLFPEEWNRSNLILNFHLIGVHTFAKIDINDSLTINWFDSEWFEERLKENKIRIKHEENSANILLTARPKELQKFVMKYSDDINAFDDGLHLVLKRKL